MRREKKACPGPARELRIEVTTQTLKGIKGNEGTGVVEFPYFLHFLIGQAEQLRIKALL
jgi:hypothetical protein